MKLDEIDFWERVLRGEGAASRGQQAEATSSVTVRYDWGGQGHQKGSFLFGPTPCESHCEHM